MLRYLQVTQEADGHWPQNMWLDGTPYWSGVQMDETAFPDPAGGASLARRHARHRQSRAVLADASAARPAFWYATAQSRSRIAGRKMRAIRRSRWRSRSPRCSSPPTSRISDGQPEQARYLRETADAWKRVIERWTYVRATPLAQQVGVAGYYVRIAPPEAADTVDGVPLQDSVVPIKNRRR